MSVRLKKMVPDPHGWIEEAVLNMMNLKFAHLDFRSPQVSRLLLVCAYRKTFGTGYGL